MDNSISLLLSLLPPLLVLVLGYLTRRVILALLCGIFLAAFIASEFSIFNTVKITYSTLWNNFEFNNFFSLNHFWDTYNLFICIFLLILGIFVVLLQQSGGAYAYQNYIKTYVRNKTQAETSSLILSMALFIDDYFSSLTVGSVMYPLTDTYKIPRAKLAFLVDSMAAPLAILCPFSSWVAAILGFLRENGVANQNLDNTLIHASPLSTYFLIIPFILYSFILISGVWFIVIKRISFGLMHTHEQIALTTNNLFGGQNNPDKSSLSPEHNPQHTTLTDFLVPVMILLISVLAGMLYSGKWSFLGGTHTALQALQNSSAAVALFIGGTSSLAICITFFIVRQRISLSALPSIFWQGICLMIPAVIILMLAWSLGDILRNNLHTGEYIASLMLESVSLTFLPTILFFASTLIAFAIGSSWGTAAMIFPIAMPLVFSLSKLTAPVSLEQIPMLFPALGAVLSGCVAGDHISPISDTTIMSATSARSPHMDHVQTQLPLSIPMIIMTGIAFLVASNLMHYGWPIAVLASILFGIVGNMLCLTLLSKKLSLS